MKLGFVGTGAITEAIVTGLAANSGHDLSVTISPRNAAIAARLADRFPNFVKVATCNQ